MRIFNEEVFGLEQAIKRSRYPMKLDIEQMNYYYDDFEERWKVEANTDEINRAISLGNTPSGSGHSNFATGIVVQFDIDVPQYMWMQMERYHFLQIISSQSKMHRILQMNLKEQCNEDVDDEVIAIVEKYIKQYNEAKIEDFNKKEQYQEYKQRLFRKIISNCPMGLNLTAGITTNYLQLQTIYRQRKNHKLTEWREFCEWLKSLPMFEELMLKGE